MSMATPKRSRRKSTASKNSKSEPVVEHERITCPACVSTDIERVCETRKPLVLADHQIRWYRRRCRKCKQVFITKEKDYTV